MKQIPSNQNRKQQTSKRRESLTMKDSKWSIGSTTKMTKYTQWHKSMKWNNGLTRLFYIVPHLSILLLTALVVFAGLPVVDDATDITASVATQSAEEVIVDAMYAYSYFVLFPFELESERIDGWAKVKDSRLNTVEKLHAYCRQTFSEEICHSLMNNGKYIEKNGYLYATGNGRPKRNDILSTTYQLIEQSDDTMAYEVVVTYQNKQGSAVSIGLTFVRQREGNSWVFTTFPFFW